MRKPSVVKKALIIAMNLICEDLNCYTKTQKHADKYCPAHNKIFKALDSLKESEK